MADLLAALSQRWIVVGLALGGAALVMLASLLTGDRANERQPWHVTALSRVGYALTGASILLFIVAGFLSGK